MSLLQQMRPTRKEMTTRRWAARDYDPSYNLYQHLTVPGVDFARETRPPKFPHSVRQTESGACICSTRYGPLDRELIDKFSKHLVYTSEAKNEYVGQMAPTRKPPDYGSTRYLGVSGLHRPLPARYESGAQDWQRGHTYWSRQDGLLPEAKVWPSVAEQGRARAFPHHNGQRTDLYRTLKDHSDRTPEEKQLVQAEIRDLVRRDKLMPQYQKPAVGQTTFRQKELRPYEPLERPDFRVPAYVKSTYHAMHRSFPPHEYRQPRFPHLSPLSNTTTLIHPYNPYNLRFPSLGSKLTDRQPWDKPLFLNQF